MNITHINGKKLTQPQLNLLNKLEGLGLRIPFANVSRTNPYSGAQFDLVPLCGALVDWVLDNYNNGQPRCGVQTWDRAKYLILAFWPEVYYGLID